MRVADRNGSRRRLLATQAEDVQLRIPKLRKGSFFPVILEPPRRIDEASVLRLYVPLVVTEGQSFRLAQALPAKGGDARARLNELGDLLTASGEIVMTVDKRDARCEP